MYSRRQLRTNLKLPSLCRGKEALSALSSGTELTSQSREYKRCKSFKRLKTIIPGDLNQKLLNAKYPFRFLVANSGN